MADENEGGRQWIVEPPPAPGEVSIYLSGGDGVELNAEQEAALGALLVALEMGDIEVMGFDTPCKAVMLCSPESTCAKLACGKVFCHLECRPLVNSVSATSSTPSWNLMGTFVPNAG